MGEAGSSARAYHWGKAATIAIVTMLVISGAFVLLGPDMGAEGLDVSGGTITVDVTWTISDSPVTILGNLKVDTGATLKVMPGVVVIISEGCFLEVKGRLIAVGTSDSPIGMGSPTNFDRINITQGGNTTLDHVVLLGSQRGLFVESAGSTLRVRNSTIQSSGNGITAQSGAEAWAVSCKFDATRNVSVNNAIVHEGNWLFFRAFRDDNLKGYPGVELEVTATKPQGSTWTVFDSKAGDPMTDASGKLPPIMVEQYLHEGSSSGQRVNFQIRMWEKNWFNTEYPLYMGKDMYYNWSLDLTPPPPPFNLTIKARGDHWLRVEWEMGNVSDVKEFNLTYKLDWQADKDYTVVSVPNTLRGHNLTGLVEEMLYDVKVNALDFSENPSTYTGPIKVRTLDLTDPDPPEDPELVGIGGNWANVRWVVSPSFDVMGYKVFRNGTGQGNVEIMDVPGRLKAEANLTGLASETDYTLWVVAYDDAEVPNLSNLNASLKVRTLDITPPVEPEVSLWFIDPPQYIPGSLFYNQTNVGLKGKVPGEDRDFVDVLVNGEAYQLPVGVSRFTTDRGNFSFFVQLVEGMSRIQVRAVDPAGNLGQLSEELSIVVDLTPPALSIWQKGSPTMIVDKDQEFALNCTTFDENGVQKIVWRVEGPSYEVELEGEQVLLELPLGEYTARCSVTDLAGNTAVSTLAISSLVPDVTPPAAVATYPTEGSTVDLDIEMWVKFSETLNWGLLAHSLVRKSGQQGLVDTELMIDNANLTAIVKLMDNLEDSTNYTLVIEGITDLRGNRAPDLSIDFKTIDKDSIDSDGDGIPDYFEVMHISFLSPSDPSDASKDKDKDGLSNLEEYTLGTDLEDADTDKDEMDDGWEESFGLDPLSNADALQDLDGDGSSNLDEFKAGTDPTDETDVPGETGDEKVPVWLWVLGAIVILLLVAIIIGSVMMYSRRSKGTETGRTETIDEGPEGTTDGSLAGELDECQECGAPLDEGSGICPVCGKVVRPHIEGHDDGALPSLDDDLTGPTPQGELGTEGPDGPLVDELDPFEE